MTGITCPSCGTTFYGLGRWSDSIPLHEQALEQAVGAGDRIAEAYALHGLSETYAFAGPIGCDRVRRSRQRE